MKRAECFLCAKSSAYNEVCVFSISCLPRAPLFYDWEPCHCGNRPLAVTCTLLDSRFLRSVQQQTCRFTYADVGENIIHAYIQLLADRTSTSTTIIPSTHEQRKSDRPKFQRDESVLLPSLTHVGQFTKTMRGVALTPLA